MHACKHLAIIVSGASLLRRLTITFSLYIIYILVVCSGSREPSKHVKMASTHKCYLLIEGQRAR